MPGDIRIGKAIDLERTKRDPDLAEVVRAHNRAMEQLEEFLGQAVGDIENSVESVWFRIVKTAVSYTMKKADCYVGVTSTAAARTITLAPSALVGEKVVIIKDESGGAATNNITVDGGGAETIDDALTLTIDKNYGCVALACDGTEWCTLWESRMWTDTTYSECIQVLPHRSITANHTVLQTDCWVSDVVAGGLVVTLPQVAATAVGKFFMICNQHDSGTINKTQVWGDGYTITVVDQGNKIFTIAGDHTAEYAQYVKLGVYGSTGNDGTYTVASVALNGANTEITVDEAIPHAAADGDILHAVGGACPYYVEAAYHAVMVICTGTGWHCFS